MRRSDDCAAPDARLAAFLDGELPMAERRQLELHLRSCLRCAADLAQQRAVQVALREAATTLLPSSTLGTELQLRLDRAEHRRSRRRRLIALGGLAAMLALLAAAGLLFRPAPRPSASVLARAADAHQQQTLGPSPVTFASTDGAAVEEWARGQTGQSIDVPSLDPAGLLLVGGRLEREISPQAVALVYQGTAGRITCTILPVSAPVWAPLPLNGHLDAIRVSQFDGVALATWEDGNRTYILAADLSPSALLQIARLARQSDS